MEGILNNIESELMRYSIIIATIGFIVLGVKAVFAIVGTGGLRAIFSGIGVVGVGCILIGAAGALAQALTGVGERVGG